MAEGIASDAADQRWTVRGVTAPYREAATAAAGRAGLSVGAWLSQAIDRAVQAEREPFDALPPSPSPASPRPPSGGPTTLEQLAIAERLITASVALAGAPEVPTAFRRRANKLLRDALPGPDRREPVRRLAIAAPEAETE